MRNAPRSPLPPPWFRPPQSSLTRDLPSLPPGGPREDIDNWPDERIWKELPNRLGAPGWALHDGPRLDKSITPMRRFGAEPMRYGKLFLAGDAAPLVPPTEAKGLNRALPKCRGAGRCLQGLFPIEGAAVRSTSQSALPRPGLAGAELLHHHDPTTPPQPRGRLPGAEAAAGPPGSHRAEPGRLDRARRELRRPPLIRARSRCLERRPLSCEGPPSAQPGSEVAGDRTVIDVTAIPVAAIPLEAG